jgi:hypothetical protein
MDDRLDAAQALLGVSPSSSSFFPLSISNSSSFGKFGAVRLNNNLEHDHKPATTSAEPSDTDTLETASLSKSVDSQQSLEPIIVRRPRSNSAGLDALAFLATKEQASMQSQEQQQQQLSFGRANNHHHDYSLSSRVPLVVVSSLKANNGPEVPLFVASAISSSSSSSSSDEDDSEAMPPPPPRSSVDVAAVTTGRRRSVSNPEGMEKWAPTNMSTTRLRFVLPTSILEEEMAEASAAIKAQEEKRGIARSSFSFPRRKRGGKPTTALDEDDLTTLQEEEEEDDEEEEEEEEDEANLSQDELLRRARSRLLEDLSESNLTGEKGILTLPHSLDKYKEVRFLCSLSLALHVVP